MSKPAIILAALGALVLAGCGPQEPIRIGFIGGLSDRNSDNGQSGLNGVILAVEDLNRAGGSDGRLVELIARDDAQNRETAANSAGELVAAKVEAVIGPADQRHGRSDRSHYGQGRHFPGEPDDHVDGFLRQGRLVLPQGCESPVHAAQEAGQALHILHAVQAVNERQKQVLIDKIVARFGPDLRGRRFALCGAWPSNRVRTTCAKPRVWPSSNTYSHAALK